MKKLIALILAMTLVLSLAACGGDEQTANLDDAPETSAATDSTDETQETTNSTEEPTEATTPETTVPPTTEPDETKPTETTPPATEPEETTPTQPTHKHSYSSKVTKAATCTEKGVKTFTCSCGNSYTEDIKATGHSYSAKTTKEPTCTEKGVKTFTCKCSSSYTEAINAAGHAWGEWVVIEPADAYHKGVSQRACKNCSATEDKTLPMVQSIESTLSTSINLTGTEHEAFIRQYACDNAPDSYGPGMDGSYFYFNNVPTNNVINFLSLSNADAYFSVGHREGQVGALYSSYLEGISPYANLGAEEMVRKTAEECSAMLNRPINRIDVMIFSTGEGVDDEAYEYNSFDDIPDDIWEKVALGQADISVNYEFSSSYVSAGVSIRGGNRIMFGIMYFEALNSLT